MYAYIFRNKSAVQLLKIFKGSLREGDIILWLKILKLIYMFCFAVYPAGLISVSSNVCLF